MFSITNWERTRHTSQSRQIHTGCCSVFTSLPECRCLHRLLDCSPTRWSLSPHSSSAAPTHATLKHIWPAAVVVSVSLKFESKSNWFMYFMVHALILCNIGVDCEGKGVIATNGGCEDTCRGRGRVRCSLSLNMCKTILSVYVCVFLPSAGLYPWPSFKVTTA